MRIDFGQQLIGLDGTGLVDTGRPLTLQRVCVNGLLNHGATGVKAEPYDRYRLAMRLHAGGTVELSTDEVVLVKKCVNGSYPPLVVGQAYEMLEGRPLAIASALETTAETESQEPKVVS